MKTRDRSDSLGPRRDAPPGALPFSRPFAVDRLQVGETVEVEIEATAAERAALAELNDLVRLDRLKATFAVARQDAGRVSLTGEVDAAMTQTCVVSLEPFDTQVREPVDVSFAPQSDLASWSAASSHADPEGFVHVDDAVEPPDPIVDGRIDLGVVAGEFLALGLDPYPRRPGASFEAPRQDPDSAVSSSPFASLEQLKSPRG